MPAVIMLTTGTPGAGRMTAGRRPGRMPGPSAREASPTVGTTSARRARGPATARGPMSTVHGPGFRHPAGMTVEVVGLITTAGVPLVFEQFLSTRWNWGPPRCPEPFTESRDLRQVPIPSIGAGAVGTLQDRLPASGVLAWARGAGSGEFEPAIPASLSPLSQKVGLNFAPIRPVRSALASHQTGLSA